MQIDWLTVSAQIVNFLILVYLLKRLLYQPVTAAMARRESRIAERLNESREREAAAEREREHLHERMERLEERRDAILEQAREEAEETRKGLMQEAREDADAARAEWRRQIDDERDAFLDALERRSAEEFEAMARQALTDLADVALEDRMLEALVGRLADMDEDSLAHFRRAEGPITAATAFELDDGRRETIRDAVRRHIRDDADVAFETSPSLLCGIELTADGRRLGWSLADYLERFAAAVDEHLDAGRAERSSDAEADKEAHSA